VTISKEDFPVIKLTRKKDVNPNQLSYGPYPESSSIKEGLKIIQKIFPFRDEKCKIGKKPCFNYQIGLCPGTCIGKIDKKACSTTIRNIKLFFEGKKGALIKLLEKEMKQLIVIEEFENAAIKRNQIWALEHIRDVSLLKNNVNIDKDIQNKNIFRIESYDIAHMGGKDMVGVMTVMENGELNKSEYRKFIIKNFSKSNDTGALNEMLIRRIKHTEWRSANLVVIDGGQAQLNTAQRLLENTSVVSVVKDDNHEAKGILGDKILVEKYRTEIIQINAETHRYAINFHKRLRNKAFIPKD
jgi:excinuclease UvrABC nuclease subunit